MGVHIGYVAMYSKMYVGTKSSKKTVPKPKPNYEWDSSVMDSIEFRRVYLDAKDRVLYGVQTDGGIVSPSAVPDDVMHDILLFERQYI